MRPFPRLTPTKFRLPTEVNPNGVRFLDTPEGFHEHFLCSAPELHHGHASVPMNQSELVVPNDSNSPSDNLNFVLRMLGALPQSPQLRVVGASPWYHALEPTIGKGSLAS